VFQKKTPYFYFNYNFVNSEAILIIFGKPVREVCIINVLNYLTF